MKLKFRCWNDETMVSPDYIDRKGIAHWKENSIPESTDEVMLWTGLKDKNGKEIYEGDILNPHEEKRVCPITMHTHPKELIVVEFDYGYFGIRDLGTIDGFVSNLISPEPDDWEGFEVIGNIYEHKCLLDKETIS